MGIEEIELEGIEYFYKFKERLEIAMAYMSDGRDISEDDMSLLEQIFRVQHEGRLPLYKTICTDSVTTSTQPDLFTDTFSCSDNGTVVEYCKPNQKQKKNGNKKIQK